jgi:hypothetical protein
MVSVVETHPLYHDTPETDTAPMSVGMFKQLSQVNGFNRANGASYDMYITQWMQRRKVTTDPRSPNYDATVDALKRVTAHMLSTLPFATVTHNGHETTEGLEAVPDVFDGTHLRTFLEKVKERHECTEPLVWTRCGQWRNENVSVHVHPSIMLLVEWTMVLVINTGAALQPVIDQFVLWVPDVCSDAELCAAAAKLSVT